MKYETPDDLIFTYCKNVFRYIKKFCDLEMKFGNFVFLDCCWNFMSLTLSEIGKYGCMWGETDLLHWFQCVFNVQVYMTNKQQLGDKIMITFEFVNLFFFQNLEECKADDGYENDIFLFQRQK